MDAERFYRTVQEHDEIDDESAAEEATSAVLGALGARISDGEAEELADFLPEETRRFVRASADEEPESFEDAEFVARVSNTADVSEDRAKAYADAVCSALAETAPHEELRDVTAQLPAEVQRFFGEVRQ